MNDISDRELLQLIIAADDEALSKGEEPQARSLSVIPKVMEKLGYKGSIMAGVGTPPIVARIVGLHRSLYREGDLAIGGIHGGVFMFRDVFARISVPIGFGRFAIDPFKLTDLTPMQLQWLCSRPDDLRAFNDQFVDIFDFAGGIAPFAEFKAPPKEALEIFWLSAFQLQSAAAALSVAFDFRGAIQSALIGAELALKAGLAAIGASEKAREKLGHKLDSAASAYANAMPNFDIERVLKVTKRLPHYVQNRYSPEQPNRVQTGHIVMGAQYIAGEVMRQVTGYSIRSAHNPPDERFYP